MSIARHHFFRGYYTRMEIYLSAKPPDLPLAKFFAFVQFNRRHVGKDFREVRRRGILLFTNQQHFDEVIYTIQLERKY